MFSSTIPATLGQVTPDLSDNPDPLLVERGLRLKERVKALGLTVTAVARLAGFGSRDTVYKVYKGTASPGSVAVMEAAIDGYEANPDDGDFDSTPRAVQSTEEGLIEIELDDVYGIGRIVVRGPEHEALVESVVEIVRRIREASTRDEI